MTTENQTAALDLDALPVFVSYVGETVSPWDNSPRPRMVDQWRIEIKSPAGFWSTAYYTGTGLRETIRGARAMAHKNAEFINGHWQATRPKRPTNADVLHSLTMDANAAEENFSDWCDNLGLSDDSLKALNTYKQCLEIAAALRRHFKPDTLAAIREAVADH